MMVLIPDRCSRMARTKPDHHRAPNSRPQQIEPGLALLSQTGTHLDGFRFGARTPRNAFQNGQTLAFPAGQKQVARRLWCAQQQ